MSTSVSKHMRTPLWPSRLYPSNTSLTMLAAE